ncbi:MAG: SDR family oxidoreductase [Enterobacterales bacterium]|nr:SDR family oxidoreductase [Enterobacterales bacterium]
MRVLITGANQGIGLQLCVAYQQKGYEVIAVCRNASTELQALECEIIDSIDVIQKDAIARLKQKVGARKIDLLINNAGIYLSQSLDSLNYDAIRQQFEVNTLGPLRVVEALLGNLEKASKIAMISSRMGSIEDNSSGGSYGYRMSKGALNVASKSLAVDLKGRGIALAILHPGYVQTKMVNYNGDISAELSASRLIERIEALNLDNTGTFWHSNGAILPW